MFRTFLASLKWLQKELTTSYWDDKFLQNRLNTVVHSPSAPFALRNWMLYTGTQIANRIANRLSDIPRIAGSSTVHYSPSGEDPVSNQPMYTLRQNYKGATKRSIRPYDSKGSTGISRIARMLPYAEGTPKTFLQKRCCPSWICGIKMYFVWGESHCARQQHSGKTFEWKCERLKRKYSNVRLTVNYLT